MSAVQRLSWGRYPAHPQTLHAVHWRCDLPHTLSAIVHTHSTTLPFGNGRSYGDSCLAASDHALHMGALANDVHGKNHHVRGTLGRHVRRFSLIRSDRLPLICAPEENTELFTATI